MIHWKNNEVPQSPYIASIFNYYLSDNLDGYAAYDDLTLELAKQMPGYLGYESFKHDGRGAWYKYYHSVIAEVKTMHVHGG
jgi:hypothetical protein